jgi:DNA-binding CsgD family transcriptional regulator
MARRLGTPHAEAESLDELGHALRVEDPHRALDVYHEACARRREHDLRTHLTDTLDHLALSAARFDEPRDAARLLGASDEARKVIGYPRPPIDRPEVTATRRHLRSILGDDEYRRATAEGSALDLDAAVTYATRTRGPRGRPSVGWASLTPTEHELVDLVADGLTNPQIAERLLVSRSTVKAHLGRIYVKLDIRNRAELAAETARRTEH